MNSACVQIPRILHLYWDGSPMSYMQLLTVVTFNHYNPGWNIYVWMPESKYMNKTWVGNENKVEYVGKDYFRDLMTIGNISIQKLDFIKIGFLNDVSEVHKSDYMRYWALCKYGGIYADFDIIFIKPVFECFKDIKKDNIDAVTIVYKSSVFPIGFMMAKKDSKFFNHILQNISKYYDKNQYESLGAALFRKLFVCQEQIADKFPNTVILNQSSYLPYLWYEANEIFDTNINRIKDDTIGIHWFNGASHSKKIQNMLDDIGKVENLPDGIIFKYIQKFIQNYKKYSNNKYFDYTRLLNTMSVLQRQQDASLVDVSKKNDFYSNIPIYIINLPDSVDRRNHIISEFDDYKYLTFVEAVDGRDTSMFKSKYNVQYNTNIPYSASTIAVICSHSKAIYIAYKNGLDSVCIFEDDVHTELIKKCNFTLKDVCEINNMWDIIQLYGTNKLAENYKDFVKSGINLLKRVGTNSGSCYIINRKGMEKFLTSVVKVNDDMNEFTIIPEIKDPEDILFNSLNAYIINRPFVYYCFESQTFISYMDNSKDNQKSLCQQVHSASRDLLFSLYK